jgi:hypothetical protein
MKQKDATKETFSQLLCVTITLKDNYGYIMAQERKKYICKKLLDAILSSLKKKKFFTLPLEC